MKQMAFCCCYWNKLWVNMECILFFANLSWAWYLSCQPSICVVCFFFSFLGLLLDTAPLCVYVYVCAFAICHHCFDLGTYRALAPGSKSCHMVKMRKKSNQNHGITCMNLRITKYIWLSDTTSIFLFLLRSKLQI